MEENKNGKISHKGHRERLRQKVIKSGINSLAEHEVLELILFYAIPRKNTNDIAHRLIDRFGSLSSVLEASYEQLIKVDGVSESAAFVIKSIPEISSYYLNNKKDNKIKKFTHCSQIYDFFAPLYVGKTKEIISIVFLSNANKFLGYEFLSEGIANSSEIQIRKLYELCIKYDATTAIIVHNHPSGNSFPSNDDFIATKLIIGCLKAIQVRVIDHIIIGDDEYSSMASMKQYKHLFVEEEATEK